MLKQLSTTEVTFSRSAELSDWVAALSTRLPNLSRPQAFVLAAWSFAAIVAQACAITTCAAWLAQLWDQPDNTVRQRLREWCYEKEAKAGHQRTELEPSACFAHLLRWLISYWPATHPFVALALDATLLGDRFAVLSCCVLYRGCAIPVAWKVLPANQKGAWQPHWLALLQQLDDVVPASWTVLVLADRGLYAKWLFAAIVQNGWHPFLRIQRQGKFRLAGQAHWRELQSIVPQVGRQWQGAVSCFKNEGGRLECTLLGRWEQGHEQAWLIVTDLSVDQADSAWYGLRSWVECGFKDLKSGGWHWEQTRMNKAERVERLWLVLAVATLWAVSVGGAAEASAELSGLERLAAQAGLSIAELQRLARPRRRRMSCLRQGLVQLLRQLLQGEPVDIAAFWPEDWPCSAQRPSLSFTDLSAAAALPAAAA